MHSRTGATRSALALAGAALMLGLVACGRDRAPENAKLDTATGPRANDVPPVVAGRSDPATWRVSEQSFGPLRTGMTITDAFVALTDGSSTPVALEGSVASDRGTASCDYARVRGGPSGVSMMVERAVIVRFDVDSGAVTTVEGARIGDSEARIRELYGSRVVVTPHKYTAGHYLTVPTLPPDTGFKYVFETDGTIVTRFRGGRAPAVDYVERCG
jgi:hypothetical protein